MNKEFKSSPGLLFLKGVSVWMIYGFILSMPVLFLAPAFSSAVGHKADAGYYLPALAVAAIIAVIPALIMTLLVYNVTVSVGPDDVTYMRGESIRNRFPLKGNSFSANIQTTNYYGSTTVTNRMLSVITNDIRKEYNCSSFTKDTFDLMLGAVQSAALYANNPGMREIAASIEEDDTPAKTFTIPRENIITIMSRKGLRLNLAGVIISFVISVLCFAFAASDLDAPIFMFALMMFIMFLISGIVFLFRVKLHAKFMKNTPLSVTIDQNTIRIDDQIFNRSDIDYIKATAPAYAKAENLPLRKILIASRFGNSEYWFGGDNILSRKCVVYGEYPALYREIANFLLRDGKLIVNDL